MGTPEKIAEKYHDMWTDALHRYALVRDPITPDRYSILDLEQDAWVVIEEPPEVVSLLRDKMRHAGVKVLSMEELVRKL